jgi:lipopolysaccharide export system protein LptC
MHKRTAHRWRLTIIMLTGTFLAFGSFWFAQVFESDDAALQADLQKNEPDYIVEKFSYVRMTADGKPRYLISGDKLTHRPLDDSADVVKPLVRTVAADRPPTVVAANTAHIDHHNTQVHLAGNVQIDRKAESGNRLQMKTEALTIFPDEDQMKTDKPVHLATSDGTVVTGTGMFVDNASRKVQIDTRVHMTLPARHR